MTKTKTTKFMPEYKYWAWWKRLTKQEQEEILKKVYEMQETNTW